MKKSFAYFFVFVLCLIVTKLFEQKLNGVAGISIDKQNLSASYNNKRNNGIPQLLESNTVIAGSDEDIVKNKALNDTLVGVSNIKLISMNDRVSKVVKNGGARTK